MVCSFLSSHLSGMDLCCVPRRHSSVLLLLRFLFSRWCLSAGIGQMATVDCENVHSRCQAVVNPLRKRPLSRKRSLHAITVIWVFSALTALPLTVVAKVCHRTSTQQLLGEWGLVLQHQLGPSFCSPTLHSRREYQHSNFLVSLSQKNMHSFEKFKNMSFVGIISWFKIERKK